MKVSNVVFLRASRPKGENKRKKVDNGSNAARGCTPPLIAWSLGCLLGAGLFQLWVPSPSASCWRQEEESVETK